ncbi:MAG: hypothetical protein LBI03_08940 [Clostridiales bacterium]|jgi:hypothetical protein|nr:hypothetical protein [Clostridiales bacterium]
MANISCPSGTFKLIGNWTQTMIVNINIIKKEWEEWWYNTVVEGNFALNKTSLPFWGQGRWAYSHNLERIGESTGSGTKASITTAYLSLCKEMESQDCYIEVDYVDEEGGCLVLYEATAKLYAKDGKLIVAETNYTEYQYNKENLKKLGYEYEELDDDDKNYDNGGN